MRELSLNVMDIVQNSITAGATLITILVEEQTAADLLKIEIGDNGCGMDAEQLGHVQSPFFSSRTTRKIGLGVPLFKMACEMTGGRFAIDSAPGTGTTVAACFVTTHIDMTPIGNMGETVLLLVTCNPGLDFVYTRTRGATSFTLDTRELREILGAEVALSNPEVVEWLRDYLHEQHEQLESP